MKINTLLTALIVFAFGALNAQHFEWTVKSPAAHPKEVQTTASERQAFNELQTGVAGVYNADHQGTRTHYGEVYANNQLTASHPNLPFGTIVQLQNLDNNRTISVRINDRGQECSNCLTTISQTAAKHLGITDRARVSVKRTGFSNWNPAAPAMVQQSAPVAYNTPVAYTATAPVPQPQQRTYSDQQWQRRTGGVQPQAPSVYGVSTSPVAYNQPVAYAPTNTYNSTAAYGSTPVTAREVTYPVVNTSASASVMSREVQPARVSRQAVTYSRYPTAVMPSRTTNPQNRTYQPVQRAYVQKATVQQPVVTTPVVTIPVSRQVAPPNSTVARYQDSRTVPAPTNYSTPATYAPRAYVVPVGMTARSVEAPAAPVAATPIGGAYAVQLGAYSNEVYAQNRVAQLKGLGINNVFYRAVQKSDGQIINRVYSGNYTSIAEAQTASRSIQGNYKVAGIVSKL